MRFASLQKLFAGDDSNEEIDDQNDDGNSNDDGSSNDDSNSNDDGSGDDGAGDDDAGGNDDDAGGNDDGAGGDDGATDTTAAAQAATAAEARRWAQVIQSEASEGRLELAFSLLAEGVDNGTQRSAESIITTLGFAAQDRKTSMQSRLRTTPKHNLGGNQPSGEGKSGDQAAESRRRATRQANAGRGNVKTTNAKQRDGRADRKKED